MVLTYSYWYCCIYINGCPPERPELAFRPKIRQLPSCVPQNGSKALSGAILGWLLTVSYPCALWGSNPRPAD